MTHWRRADHPRTLPQTLVHPASKTHRATRQRQPSLLTASCCAPSQVMPMLFKSGCMVSIQFFRGLPGFLFLPVLLISKCTPCLDSLLASIRRTCPNHLSLLSFMMRSIFFSCVSTLTLSRFYARCPSCHNHPNYPGLGVVVVVVEIFIHGRVKATVTNAPQSQLNKWVISSFLNWPTVMSDWRSEAGRLFQSLVPATWKARSPKPVRVRGTTQVETSDERSRRQPTSETSWQSSDK